MITVVQGKIGDGKSYHVTRLAIDHMLAGGVVATNMQLDLDRIKKNFGRRLSYLQYLRVAATDSPYLIPRGDMRGRGRRRVMVVLDEALNWFASSSGSKDDRKATWGEWLRQSDKLGQDVFFIAQNFERSAKWVRELAQVLISITNLRNVSFLHMPIGRWCRLGRVYAAASYDIRSTSLIGWRLGLIDSRVYRCYNTSELYGFPASENAYDSLVVAPAFRLPVFPFVLFFLWFLLVWVFL